MSCRHGTLLALLVTLVSPACWGDDGYWQADAASEMRELSYLREVTVVRMTREEFAARAAAQADDIDEEYLQYYADTYGRLGFFDRHIDLRPIFAVSSSEWVGASYSLGNELITLVGQAPDDTIVHEYVHALQDQNFDLVAYDALDTSDAFLARRAVVEGDASLAQARYIMVYERGGELDDVDWLPTFESRRSFSEKLLLDADYPVVFLDYPSFVYTFGFEYTAYNLVGVSYDDPESVRPTPHDWQLEDELFTSRIPDTTEEILLRDVFLDQADPVVEIGLSEVPAELVEDLQPVDWDVLGEWYVYLLLHPLEVADGLEARTLAAAWDGDRALFVRDRASGAPGVLWASAWDDEESAAAMADALGALYGLRRVKGAPDHVALADDGETVWMERRGTKLVVARNIVASLAGPLADAAFRGTPSSAPRKRPSLAATIERLRKVVRY